jgi:mono/diheme cytochrome c family protein
MRITRYLVLAAALALLVGVARWSQAAPQSSAAPASDTAAYRAMVDRYCVGCHNQRAQTAGVMLDTMDLANVGHDGEVWEKVIRKLRAGMMPPPGMPQPERASVDSMVNWLETTLDEAAAADPHPGRVVLHRMNRIEYSNAVEDLMGIRVDASALLPTDDVSNGFDNIANVLKVSPSFL